MLGRDNEKHDVAAYIAAGIAERGFFGGKAYRKQKHGRHIGKCAVMAWVAAGFTASFALGRDNENHDAAPYSTAGVERRGFLGGKEYSKQKHGRHIGKCFVMAWSAAGFAASLTFGWNGAKHDVAPCSASGIMSKVTHGSIAAKSEIYPGGCC